MKQLKELIEWLKEEENIFVDEFLLVEKELLPREIEQLKYEDDFIRAKAIEQMKLKKYAAADRLNVSMVKHLIEMDKKTDTSNHL